jgi:hypothetical protein
VLAGRGVLPFAGLLALARPSIPVAVDAATLIDRRIEDSASDFGWSGKRFTERPDRNDAEQLRFLAIFHYVVGGMAALFSLVPLVHLVMGLAVVTGHLPMEGGGPGDRMVGWFFVGLALIFIAAGLTFAAVVVAAGRSLSRQVRYTFCLVVAGLECLFIPIGTVLGVFTIVVLRRAGVREGFGKRPPAPAGAA